MRVKKITDLARLSLDEFREVDKLPLIIVLDNVRSLNNIGSVFRTSDAFRIQSVFLCGITATPPNVDMHKTALGAEDSVDWMYFENTIDALFYLRNMGFCVGAIEQAEGSLVLDGVAGLDPNLKYALVLGNEVRGVSQAVVDMCDLCIEIPQEGTKHSLNVSVAAGIVMWDFFKLLKKIK